MLQVDSKAIQIHQINRFATKVDFDTIITMHKKAAKRVNGF